MSHFRYDLTLVGFRPGTPWQMESQLLLHFLASASCPTSVPYDVSLSDFSSFYFILSLGTLPSGNFRLHVHKHSHSIPVYPTPVARYLSFKIGRAGQVGQGLDCIAGEAIHAKGPGLVKEGLIGNFT